MGTIMDDVRAKARADKMRIVFPESWDERILRACEAIVNEGIALPYLIGDRPTIEGKARELGVSLNGVEVRDPDHDHHFEAYCTEFVELRKGKGMTLDEAKKAMKDAKYFAAMMIRMGHADGCVTGATHATADTIRPAVQVIRMKEGFKIASSYFLMYKGDEKLFFADCGFVVNPNADELAEIAIATNDSAREYGVEPKVAMLSFSTKGSAKHEMVDKVRQATDIVKQKRGDILVDGELQFDAAYVPKVAAAKCPDSPLKGRANVFIFPELNAGNICYKTTQRLGGYSAIGPVIQGLNKPMNDLSRGCSAEDIVELAAITAVQAQNSK